MTVKSVESKKKISDNSGHDKLELYNVSSKTKHDIYYNKPGIRVASEQPNDLKIRVLENLKNQKNLKLRWRHSLVPSFPSRKLNCGNSSQKVRKNQTTKFSSPVQFYWISLLCSKYFVGDCRSNIHLETSRDFWKFIKRFLFKLLYEKMILHRVV